MSKSLTNEELINLVDQLEQRVAKFDGLYSILFQLEKKNVLLKELNEKLEGEPVSWKRNLSRVKER